MTVLSIKQRVWGEKEQTSRGEWRGTISAQGFYIMNVRRTVFIQHEAAGTAEGPEAAFGTTSPL